MPLCQVDCCEIICLFHLWVGIYFLLNFLLPPGLHRYVFVVYKQPGKLTFDEPRLPNSSGEWPEPLDFLCNFSSKVNCSFWDLGFPWENTFGFDLSSLSRITITKGQKHTSGHSSYELSGSKHVEQGLAVALFIAGLLVFFKTTFILYHHSEN